MSRHFATIKRQPTAGRALFVKKCVFFVKYQIFIVFAYMLMTFCVCVWPSLHLMLYMFPCVFVIMVVCVGKLFYDFDWYVCICMGKHFFDFVYVFVCVALFFACMYVRFLMVLMVVGACQWASISLMLYMCSML